MTSSQGTGTGPASSPEGSLIPVMTSGPPDPQPGDILVLLGPGGNGTPQ